MAKVSRDFQVFAKPGGPLCNLECRYCYYLGKKNLYDRGDSFLMTNDSLEKYIAQHIEASSAPVVRFSWHGGEPTVLGLDYFQRIVDIQREYLPPGRAISNGIQTNGILLDEEWCRFFRTEGFTVGISLDGPAEMHDCYRLNKSAGSTHGLTMRGYRLLQAHGIPVDVLCVVHSHNVSYPKEVYGFFKEIGVTSLGLLPLVERSKDGGAVSDRSVPAAAFGSFLCTVFDEWLDRDIGSISIQIFEEAMATAFGREHALCIFRRTCGDIPVVEHNGDFFACDHFVDAEHRIGNIDESPLAELLEHPSQRAFGAAKLTTLPSVCKACEVRGMCNGGCPKDRFLCAPNGEPGLNYLCSGYKSFFTHCRPFAEQVAALRKVRESQGKKARTLAAPATASPKIGRNDPCLCGSGRKYKKCCMGK